MANYSIDAELKANASKFKRAIQSARRVAKKFKQDAESIEETEMDADTQPLKRNIKKARRLMRQFVREHGKTNVDIGAVTAEFFRKAALVSRKARDLARDKVVVEIDARVEKFQKKLGKIANTMRSFSTVGFSLLQGGLLAILPMISPLGAGLAGALGSIGPMLGTAAGGIAGLGTAFGLATAGAVGFGAVAVSNLNDVFEASDDLKKLQEKLAVTTDEEKRNEIMEEMAVIQGTLNIEQSKALKSLRGMQEVWSDIMGKLEKPTVQIFTKAMDALSTVLKMAEPTLQGATTAVNNLMDSLNETLQTEDVKAFFKWMGEFAGPALETMTKAGMNFMVGFMNMARAFGPLSVDMQNGFLGMSEGFREWTSSLGESKKFQAFIDYVRENGPKLLDIFGNIVGGLVGMFSAFAPLSSDMMTGLQDLTERFKKWGQTLSDNQQFQSFIDYVRENGPKVIDLIGNLTTFLVNLGIGMAPLGAWILGVVNSIISWTNSMMEAHPWIGKIIGFLITLTGILIATIPATLLLKTAFGGMVGKLITGFTKLAGKAVWWAARMAAQWLIAMGPVGWVIATVVALVALIIANWDKISSWTKKAWSAISNFISNAAKKILGYIQEKFPALYEVIKSYMENAKEIISAIWDFVKGTFKNTLKFLKSLVTGDFKGMKEAISDQMDLAKNTISRIWNAVKSFFSTVLSTIWSKIKSKFQDIVNSVRDKMRSAKNKIESIWDSVMSFFRGIDLFDMGKDIIQGLVNGIKSMAGNLVDSAKGVVDGAIEGAKNLLGINSPSRVFRGFGINTFEGFIIGVKRMKNKVADVSKNMASTATKSFNPNLQVKSSQITSSLKGLKRNSNAQVQSAVNADVNVRKQPIHITIRNEGDAEWLRTFVNEGNAIDDRISVMD